jgi:hypothetical protein
VNPQISSSISGSCPDCGSTDVSVQRRRDTTIIKVYGYCNGCDKDFGRLGTITSPDEMTGSEVDEEAQSIGERFFTD